MPIGRDRPILRDLTIHVIPSVVTKWYELGLMLLDPKYQNELSVIEADTRNDAATGCRKMFSKWLNTDEHASWNKLIEALKIVQLNNVANDIQLLLQGEYATVTDLLIDNILPSVMDMKLISTTSHQTGFAPLVYKS